MPTRSTPQSPAIRKSDSFLQPQTPNKAWARKSKPNCREGDTTGGVRIGREAPQLRGATWASEPPWMLQDRRQGKIAQGSPPRILRHLRAQPLTRVPVRPQACSCFEWQELQSSGEKAPPRLLSAPTRGRHWGERRGKIPGVETFSIPQRVRQRMRPVSSRVHPAQPPNRPMAGKTSNPCQT